MTVYMPIKRAYREWSECYSEITDKLIKRKKMYLHMGAALEEWLSLADDFLAEDGKANHAFCMWMFKKLGGDDTPKPFDYAEIIPVPPDHESDDTFLADHEELRPGEHSWTPDAIIPQNLNNVKESETK